MLLHAVKEVGVHKHPLHPSSDMPGCFCNFSCMTMKKNRTLDHMLNILNISKVVQKAYL